MLRPANFGGVSIPPPPPPIVIEKFGGVDFRGDPTTIALNRSPDMLNMMIDRDGSLDKFPGYIRAFPNFIDELNPINYLGYNTVAGKFIIAHGTKLYTFTEGSNPVELYNGVVNHKITSFFMNNKQYFLDGTNYLVWDGINPVKTVESEAYTPTLTLGRAPTGGGTPYEQVNLLQPGFKDSFSADGTAKAFTLSLTNLDATAVTATVGGVAKVEGTDFTVNRTTGVVTFTTAPPAGTNNVVITAYKTQTGFADRIKKCTQAVLFGGTNDTRLFVTGNPNYKNMDWRSGLYDPSYFPENGYTKIGSDAVAIKAYAKQYRSCLIIKEDSSQDSTIWLRTFSLQNDGTATFPIEQGSAKIGCLAPDSLQIIENDPIMLSKKGVYRIGGSEVKDERMVQHISGLVEPNLLQETNLDKAVAFDHDGKYGLCVNNKVYIFDYRNKFVDTDGLIKYESYPWDNIPASCFFEKDGYLYFGSNAKGMVYRMLKTTETNLYQADGQSINAYWKSKVLSMDADHFKKLVEKVFWTMKPSSIRNSADLYYISDKKVSELLKQSRIVLFDFRDIDFSDFSFLLSDLPQFFVKKVKAKKVVYFQVIFKNNRLSEGMSITNVTIKFIYQSEIK